MITYKFLQSGARGLFSGQAWPSPAADAPGAWFEVATGPLTACRHGIHVCRVQDLPYWIAAELWEVEIGTEWIEVRDALVARRARLTRRIESWNRAAPVFAQGCVARASRHIAGARFAADHPAPRYLEQAEQFARSENTVVAAYAAALVFGAAAGDSAMEAFRAERVEQSKLIAEVAGLASLHAASK